MKRIAPLLLLLFLLTGCDDGLYSGTLIFDGDHTFDAAARLPGDALLRSGTAEFAAGSQVAGSVYVLGGTLLATFGAIIFSGSVMMLGIGTNRLGQLKERTKLSVIPIRRGLALRARF